jgi:hypothetical protein
VRKNRFYWHYFSSPGNSLFAGMAGFGADTGLPVLASTIDLGTFISGAKFAAYRGVAEAVVRR